MRLSASRCLITLAIVLLVGCQSAPEYDSQTVLFQQYLSNNQLSLADQQLAEAGAQGVSADKLAPYERQLADAYLRQGQEALQAGDLNTATTALSRARSLLPEAPALTAGLGEALSADGQAAVDEALQGRSVALPLLDRGDYAGLRAQFDELAADVLACACTVILEARGSWQSNKAVDLLGESLEKHTPGVEVDVQVSHSPSRVPRLVLISDPDAAASVE